MRTILRKPKNKKGFRGQWMFWSSLNASEYDCVRIYSSALMSHNNGNSFDKRPQYINKVNKIVLQG